VPTSTNPTVTVCDDCGSDMCWQGKALCEKSRGAGTIDVPACLHIDDTGRQCLRPEKVHSSGWSHVFSGESRRRFAAGSGESNRDIPLRVVIVDGMLAIEIGLDTLKCVVENGPISHEFELLNIDQLAKEIAVILENDEDEIGMTPIMHAIDNAIEQAVGDGSTACNGEGGSGL
jgi:hypothetical protein